MSNITTIIVAEEIKTTVSGAGVVQTTVTPQPISTTISAVGTGGQDFVHTQSTPASAWVINHNLGVKPVVTLLTVGGVEMDAQITHVSNNQFIVSFVQPTAGSARCI